MKVDNISIKKRIKSILISQDESQKDKLSYEKLKIRYDIAIHFQPFIKVQPLPLKYFFKQKVNVLDHTAIIFTSRKSIDYFFYLYKQLKIKLPITTKYFCVSEATANYLNRYITVRKRKMFTSKGGMPDFFPMLSKHRRESFLYPCSSTRKPDIINVLKENNTDYKELIIYETVSNDLTHLNCENYDLFAFFSPLGIKSLFENFPDFQQNGKVIAVFGKTTAKAAKERGLELQIQVPLPQVPSMTTAIENYIKTL